MQHLEIHMSALSFVDTLIWTTLASTGGLLFLVLKDEGFRIGKRKSASRTAKFSGSAVSA
jgi:hypothetical protein